MRIIAIVVLALFFSNLTQAVENRITQQQIADGWILLFDGETLFGWQPTSEVDWQVEDGEIRASEGKMGLLATTTQFAEYELHVEFKAAKNTNSGIFLQSALQPNDPATDCYELNIAPPDNPFPTGSFVGRMKIDTMKPKADEWRAYNVSVRGGKITVLVDSQLVLEYKDPKPLLRGHIGLQFNSGKIAFRNIRLKPLGAKPIFNGQDLAGWNIDRAEESRFEVTPEGELRVLDGRGQIESNDRYGDFVLQLECFVNGESLNSGVFFRCIPGDFMMGYECQIHNGMKEGDPTQPADCGTGGIFRRQNARRIVANDREWFSQTLVADGAHMAGWVNGIQVSDWTDEREPHDNPRKGLRTDRGTLAIQGHDPTTDLRFRNLRIIELPER